MATLTVLCILPMLDSAACKPVFDLRWLCTAHCVYGQQEEVDKVLQRAHLDDESEMWVLERLSDTHPASALFPGSGDNGSRQHAPFGVMPSSSRPCAVQGTRRPMSQFTKAALASGDMNPRFRYERSAVWTLPIMDERTQLWLALTS